MGECGEDGVIAKATGAARRGRGRRAAGVSLFAVICGIAGGVEAQVLPDAAKPGAQRPAQERPLLPAPPAGPVFSVPAVPDRPLEIDAGEKVRVTGFDFVGATDRPRRGLYVKDLETLARKHLAAHPEGLTVGRLQEIADDVTKYYRQHGLILAQAFIPVQTVEGGRVKIRILEGKLGRVMTEGQKMYTAKSLERPFSGLVGQPVTKEAIESALLGLNAYPGLSLFGVFQPGQEVGTADMVVKVQKEKRFDGSIRYDNHGIKETGMRRYRTELSVNDVTGAADRLSGTFQHSAAPSNSLFWGLDYDRPLFFRDTSVRVHYDRNDFDVGGLFRDRNIASQTQTFNVTLADAFLRSRQRNVTGRFEVERAQAVTDIRDREQSKDDLATMLFGIDYDSVDTRFSGLNSGFLEVTHGFDDLFGSMGKDPASVKPSRQGGSRQYAQGSFDKMFGSYSRLQSLTPLSDKLKNHSLLFRAEMQWSEDLLVPLEQYSVGGPTNVRAYQPTERLFDKALFGSLEWIINAPGFADKPAFSNRTWGELLQVSLFFDIATGRINDPLPTERASETYRGIGGAVSFNNPKVFSSKVSIATPIGGPQPTNGRRPVYWFDFNFYF
mgnify:CR=1 FL=1